MARFYSSAFDPWLILLQIVIMQCLYYSSLGFWLVVFGTPLGEKVAMSQFFTYTEITLETTRGFVTLSAFLATAIVW